jgi:hypothetical protein
MRAQRWAVQERKKERKKDRKKERKKEAIRCFTKLILERF